MNAHAKQYRIPCPSSHIISVPAILLEEPLIALLLGNDGGRRRLLQATHPYAQTNKQLENDGKNRVEKIANEQRKLQLQLVN